ncbi:hypothetical protein [Yersinia bercovieri]|uniref:hypothetical protein n=1 Tax=Yersinia bercovieri TaxID=634 RepID=UPI0011A6E257|nr:hypothetical protein [Yersinia bercovieri]
MSQVISVKMARPSADEVESLYKLFHAAEAAEDRWHRESSEQFLERLDDQDISDEERAFIAVAWDSLVQGHGGFGRFMGAYDTLIYNFQDPDADHVAIHPKFNALFTEFELLPVVLEGYLDARNTIAELENERDSALNTCSLIAEALGITGAVAGDTITRVQQLISEISELKTDAKDVAIGAANSIAYAIFNLSGKTLADLKPGIIETTSPADSALIAERNLREFAASLRGEQNAS